MNRITTIYTHISIFSSQIYVMKMNFDTYDVASFNKLLNITNEEKARNIITEKAEE